MAVAVQNTAEGRPAEQIRIKGDSKAWIPYGLASNAAPRTLTQFKKANAETKELYLDKFSTTRSAWTGVFDRKLRNSIAHADAEFVISTGQIETTKGSGYSYLDFVKSTVSQTQMVLLWLDFAKLCRIYALAT
jgi:hypothetical protein